MGSALALARAGYTDIHVWESARSLGEVGAGINLTPNLSRILDRWEVLDIARAEAVALKSASVLSAFVSHLQNPSSLAHAAFPPGRLRLGRNFDQCRFRLH